MSTNSIRNGVTSVAIPSFLESLGKVGRSLACRYESGKHSGLESVTVNPKGYDDWREFFCDYQASCLLKKFPRLNLEINTPEVALKKFRATELACSMVNTAFRNVLTSFPVSEWVLLCKARSFIAKVLGDFSWNTAIQYCDFGPGASVGIPRKSSHQCEKIGNLNPTVTRECSALVLAYADYDPHMRDHIANLKIVEGSTVTTVPKDARSDRVIAIEPLWNMFFQKGIGGSIRRRLKFIGLDLNNGQPLNQELARQGSISGLLSTVDLSSASDMISLGLCEFLLPEDWFRAMMTVRSPYCTMPDGERVFLRKISSMGNGFTFELESLIFLSLCKAINPKLRVGHDVSVFGDDIIIPKAETNPLIEILRSVGFKTNIEKTFVDGPFRESCGKHFFRGHDVTPFFLKKEILNVPDLYYFINSIKRLAFRFAGYNYGLDDRFRFLWEFCLSLLPKRFRLLSCPEGYGDVAVLRDFDECCPRPTPHGLQVEGYVSRRISQSTARSTYDGVPALITKLWFTRRGIDLGEMSQYSLNRTPSSYRWRITKGLYPRWSTMGPWVNLF